MTGYKETSIEAIPSGDTKEDHVNLIVQCISIYGVLSRRQISELTQIGYTSVCPRILEHMIGKEGVSVPLFKMVGKQVIRGRRYELIDLVRRIKEPEKIVNIIYYNKKQIRKIKGVDNMEGDYPRKGLCAKCGNIIYIHWSWGKEKEYATNRLKNKDEKWDKSDWHLCREWKGDDSLSSPAKDVKLAIDDSTHPESGPMSFTDLLKVEGKSLEDFTDLIADKVAVKLLGMLLERAGKT